MPTYDYECRACGKTFEVFQSMSEAPKKKCPACGKQKSLSLTASDGSLGSHALDRAVVAAAVMRAPSGSGSPGVPVPDGPAR